MSVTLLAACAGNSGDDDSRLLPVNQSTVNPSVFAGKSLAESITTVDCTLSDGSETSCYRIVTVGVPADAPVGPFCPRTIDDTADSVGIWFDGGGTTYDIDGNFIVSLPELYEDPNWQLYDPATREVFYTGTQAGCEGAARPDVDPRYQNHCVECSLDYVDGGISSTLLIPVTPVPADKAGRLGMFAGVSLNGIVLAAPAPVADILGNYTIAAFDDCGGHINPHEGYHYHAATDCNTTAVADDGHTGLVGYALDGYGIYGQHEGNDAEHGTLDECRGTTDDVRGYHYHAASVSENLFIGCYHGLTEASAARPPGGRPPPDGEGRRPPPPR